MNAFVCYNRIRNIFHAKNENALYYMNKIFCWTTSTNASEFIGFALSAFFSVKMDYIHIAGNCVRFRTPFRSILQKFLRNF